MLDNIGKLIADKEAEELLKKKKRQKANYYLAIYKEELAKRIAAANYAKYKADMEARLKKLKENKPAFPQSVSEMASCVKHTEEARKKMLEFFSFDKLPDAPKIRETLKKVDMSEDDFKLAAFAATAEKGDDFEELAGYFSFLTKPAKPNASFEKERLSITERMSAANKLIAEKKLSDKELKSIQKEIKALKEESLKQEAKSKGNKKTAEEKAAEEKYTNVEKFNSIRDRGILKARDAFYKYSEGNPKELGKILGDAIKKSCDKFATERDMDTAMQWSMYTEEMLKIVDKHPKLMKEAGLNEEQLNMARNAAEMGKNIREGLVAIEKMAEASLDEKKELSPEENEKLLAKVVKMQATYNMRQDVIKEWDAAEKELAPKEKASKEIESKEKGPKEIGQPIIGK